LPIMLGENCLRTNDSLSFWQHASYGYIRMSRWTLAAVRIFRTQPHTSDQQRTWHVYTLLYNHHRLLYTFKHLLSSALANLTLGASTRFSTWAASAQTTAVNVQNQTAQTIQYTNVPLFGTTPVTAINNFENLKPKRIKQNSWTRYNENEILPRYWQKFVSNMPLIGS
jgi:hypothetical protein